MANYYLTRDQDNRLRLMTLANYQYLNNKDYFIANLGWLKTNLAIKHGFSVKQITSTKSVWINKNSQTIEVFYKEYYKQNNRSDYADWFRISY